MKTILAIAATLILAGQATVASAQSEETIKVGYSDLNIHSVEGVAQLDHRIHHAARAVCGYDSVYDLASRLAEARCETRALTNARAQVASFTSAYFAAR